MDVFGPIHSLGTCKPISDFVCFSLDPDQLIASGTSFFSISSINSIKNRIPPVNIILIIKQVIKIKFRMIVMLMAYNKLYAKLAFYVI